MADRPLTDVQEDIQTVPSAPPECVERSIAPHDVSQLSPLFEPLVIERVMIIVIVPDSLFGTPNPPSRDPFIISPLPSPGLGHDPGRWSNYSYY